MILKQQDAQLGVEITDKAKDIYKTYFGEVVTDEIAATNTYLAILKGIMAGMLM